MMTTIKIHSAKVDSTTIATAVLCCGRTGGIENELEVWIYYRLLLYCDHNQISAQSGLLENQMEEIMF